MKKIILESHYLASLEYYSLISQAEEIKIPMIDVFKKQTYRNRCYILSANGVLSLVIPVNYSVGMGIEDVTIDQNQRWRKDHWGAIYSTYGKAPFFDYFSDDFHISLHKGHKFLIDLNRDLLDLTLKLLRLDIKVIYSKERFQNSKENFLDIISPKESFVNRKIYTPVAYAQLFGREFSPNMSIIDLLMCEGPNSRQILSASFLNNQK
ncbi:MAG: WbqC family protein [Ekhidna sp.]|nr:WbqC family protein [Ekhidna sp.]